jgi:hypothetical protein
LIVFCLNQKFLDKKEQAVLLLDLDLEEEVKVVEDSEVEVKVAEDLEEVTVDLEVEEILEVIEVVDCD